MLEYKLVWVPLVRLEFASTQMSLQLSLERPLHMHIPIAAARCRIPAHTMTTILLEPVHPSFRRDEL